MQFWELNLNCLHCKHEEGWGPSGSRVGKAFHFHAADLSFVLETPGRPINPSRSNLWAQHQE